MSASSMMTNGSCQIMSRTHTCTLSDEHCERSHVVSAPDQRVSAWIHKSDPFIHAIGTADHYLAPQLEDDGLQVRRRALHHLPAHLLQLHIYENERWGC